uniref:Hemicentin-2-like isoform X1 n=1 Tax=Crassostrea virginica TaxID=6565 RepID=A0A8B8DRX6_CRAVI|nr:hemicentin-2-like isoform X1 [Crassostrea virginica]
MKKFNCSIFLIYTFAFCCYSQLSQDFETRIEESGLDLSYPLGCRRTKNHEVVWLHEGKAIALGNNIFNNDIRFAIETPYVLDRNLMIKNLKPDDAGRYQCKEYPDSNGSIIADYLLRLRAKASIPVSSDSRVNVLENDEVRLWCNATGLPVPTITWYAIESNNQQEFLKDIGVKGRMLGISNVSRYCSTTFQCQASNKYKETYPVYKNITLDVKFLPDVQIKVRVNGTNFLVADTISSNRAEQIELVCDVFANPLTKITWYRDKTTIGHYSAGESSPIKNDKDKTNYLYTLTNIQTNTKEPRYWSFPLVFQADGQYTSGKYWCEVTNEVGSSRKYVQIMQN